MLVHKIYRGAIMLQIKLSYKFVPVISLKCDLILLSMTLENRKSGLVGLELISFQN